MTGLSAIEGKLISVRKKQVLLDRDVAFLYGVETKRINEAVKNNPEKFPEGYVMILDKSEEQILRSKFSTLEKSSSGQHSKYGVKAFTEKGLYMLATILKSPKATETTIAIIETYAKIKELTRVNERVTEENLHEKQEDLLSKSTQLISSVLTDNLELNGTETSIELNLAILKVKHTLKRKKKEN
jgi:hypothetical protein